MDLHMVLLFLLHQSFLFTSSVFQQSKAIHYPTSRYSLLFNAKEVKQDLKRRRHHGRRNEQISLKPPPKDWPTPTLGTADFIVYNESPDATSMSPLQAYQAKLEKELINQQKNEVRDKKLLSPKSSETSSIWTSSEEDFKKLLNPDELVKHNKKLKPLVVKDKKQRTTKKNVKSTDTQSKKESKSAPITSMTALKAKSNLKKGKRKMLKSDSSKKKIAPTRRRRKKVEKKDLLDDSTPSIEVKKRKARTKSSAAAAEAPKIKRRRKKVKKFSFATSHFKESENESTNKSLKKKHSKHTSTEEISLETINKDTTSETTKATANTMELSNKEELQGTKKSDKNLTDNTTTDSPILTSINPTTVKTTELYPTVFTTTKFATQMSTTTYYTTVSRIEKLVTKSPMTVPKEDKRKEIREKRKQMKLNMEKVIIKEQLDGSFGDKDSDWTTSEEEFYVEYNEMIYDVKRKIAVLNKFRTTQIPKNVTTLKNIYKNIFQLVN